jgi:hypothetical protein
MRDSAKLRYFSPRHHLTPFLLLSTLSSLFFCNFYDIFGECSDLYRRGELTATANRGCRMQLPFGTAVALWCLDRGPRQSTAISHYGCILGPTCPGLPMNKVDSWANLRCKRVSGYFWNFLSSIYFRKSWKKVMESVHQRGLGSRGGWAARWLRGVGCSTSSAHVLSIPYY